MAKLLVFNFLNPSTNRCIQTRDIRIMSHVAYHCVNATEKNDRILLPFFFSLNAIGRIHTLDLRIICQVFYHCATEAGQNIRLNFFDNFLSPGASDGI